MPGGQVPQMLLCLSLSLSPKRTVWGIEGPSGCNLLDREYYLFIILMALKMETRISCML